MYAALYASEKEMQILLDKGASANTANSNGSTALMWAAGDTSKVDLLLKRGASVSAKTTDGTTALIAAASHGNADVVRRLVSHGADPRQTTPIGIGVQSVALFRTDNSLDRILSAARLPISLPVRPSDGPLTNTLSNPAALERFLNLGVNVNETVGLVTRAVPALMLGAYAGELETLRRMLARGSNVNVKDSYGNTPLMMASASARPTAAVVRFLLDSGADVQARDNAGRTALDWALLQGETSVVPLLRAAGATTAAPLSAAPPAASSPSSPRDAMARAVTRLQPAGPSFNQRNRCISCHNQSLPSIAVALASRRGVPVDRALAAHPTTATLAMWTPVREPLLLGNTGPLPGFVANVGYALLGFAEEGVAPTSVTDAVVLALAATQNRDGSWYIADIRPPLSELSSISYTALAIRGLDRYSPPGRRAEMQARMARARDFLRRAEPASTQDEAFKLLGLVWSRAQAADIARQSQRLLKLQRVEGGWAQMPTMAPDAYSTGQALYALHSAGTAPAAASYQKGASYLLRTQLDDGSWFVRSRAFPFQPYFDTGFPHGRNQFISAAATAWAVIALAYV